MGQQESRLVDHRYGEVPDCDIDGPPVQIGANEFQLSLDARAFEFYMLSGIKALRVTTLSRTGQWGPTEEGIFTPENPYMNHYVKITPKQNGAEITVLKGPVSFLYRAGRNAVKQLLCRRAYGSSVMYVNIRLRRQELEVGRKYMNTRDDMFILTPEDIYIVNLPDAAPRHQYTQVAEKAFDPSMLAFASRPVHNA